MAVINGTPGADTLNGTASADTINAGGGADRITGGLDGDLLRGGVGNDLFMWNLGDGSDTIVGGDGIDRARFTGLTTTFISADGTAVRVFDSRLTGIERIDLRPLGDSDGVIVGDLTGTGVTLVAVDLAGTVGGVVGDGAVDTVSRGGSSGNDTLVATIAGGTISVTGLSTQVTISHFDPTDNLSIGGGDGNDMLNAAQLADGLIRVQMGGDAGNDKLIGSRGNDTLWGGVGNDTIVGGRGRDSVILGAGNDLFEWKAGDGNDVVNGDDGIDTLRITGNAADETITITAFGAARVSRGASIVDAFELERIQVRALGGADSIAVSDLSATTVTSVLVDLAATAGGGAADKKVDTVTAAGTGNNDVIGISVSNGGIVASGLSTALRITHADATDILAIDGGKGDDSISAANLPAGTMSLSLSGGDGQDTLTGTGGNDRIRGGAGNDLAVLGAGNDTFTWSTGDGADLVKGGGGLDTWVYSGGAGADVVGFAAAGGRVEISFSFLEQVERIRVSAGAGADIITVNDLAGTGLQQVLIDLGGTGASGDGAQDVVDAVAGAGNDTIGVSLSDGVVSVSGLATQVTASRAEAIDVLNVFGGEGKDTITASTVPADAMQLVLDGGSGNDIVTGSAGVDTARGQAGNDTLNGAGGADMLNGGADSDRLTGGGGNDTLLGGLGGDVLLGGLGDDFVLGGSGNDTITGGGNDLMMYTEPGDGHDTILDFDGDPTGGQDRINLDQLLDFLGMGAEREFRVSITDNGATVAIAVDTDGIGGADLAVATLHTSHEIKLNEDVII